MDSEQPATDFRVGMVSKRLKRVRRIIPVLSGKGGVGKSVVAATLAVLLRRAGFTVGLLDADVYGPSSALLLGGRARPKEGGEGLVPPTVNGVEIMSVDLYAPGRPIPLTGRSAADMLREMLALTDWGGLDFLIIDMPPATADIMMLVTSLRGRGLEALVVTTPDRLSLSVAKRVLSLLASGEIQVAGVVGNMCGRGVEGDHERLGALTGRFGVPLAGELPYDTGVLASVEADDVGGLSSTKFAEALQRTVVPHLCTRTGARNRHVNRHRGCPTGDFES